MPARHDPSFRVPTRIILQNFALAYTIRPGLKRRHRPRGKKSSRLPIHSDTLVTAVRIAKMAQLDAIDGSSESSSVNSEKRHKRKKNKTTRLPKPADDHATEEYPAAHVARRSSLSKPGRDQRDAPPPAKRKKENRREEVKREVRISSTRSSPVLDFDGLSRPSVGTRARLEEDETKAAERLERMKGAVRTLLECVGENPDRQGLLATPERYARAMLEFTCGYQQNAMDIVGLFRLPWSRSRILISYVR